LEDGNLYLRLQTMSHTIYAAKFEQTIIFNKIVWLNFSLLWSKEKKAITITRKNLQHNQPTFL